MTFYTAAGTSLGSAITHISATVAANTWTNLVGTVAALAPATAAKVKVQITLGSTPLPVAGTTYDLTGIMIHESIASDAANLDYFDGEFTGVAWAGARCLSASSTKRIS